MNGGVRWSGVSRLVSGRIRTVLPNIFAAFISFTVGLILMRVTVFLMALVVAVVGRLLFSSGQVPATMEAVGIGIVFVAGIFVLIASTTHIYKFLIKNLDFDL